MQYGNFRPVDSGPPALSGVCTSNAEWVYAALDAAEVSGLNVRYMREMLSPFATAARIPWTFARAVGDLIYESYGENEAIGIVAAAHRPLDSEGFAGSLLCNCPTVGDALSMIVRLSPLFQDAFVMKLDVSHDVTAMRVIARPQALNSRAACEYRFGSIVATLSTLAQWPVRPLRVEVGAQEYPLSSTHIRVLGSSFRFGMPESRLVFSNTDLLRVVRGANPEALRALSANTTARLAGLMPDASFAAILRTRISSMFRHEGGASLEKLSNRLAVPSRTLQRRFQAAGTTFNRLAVEARLELAHELICLTERSIYAVALELGFENQSAFTRAFVRWTTITPTKYRALYRDGGMVVAGRVLAAAMMRGGAELDA